MNAKRKAIGQTLGILKPKSIVEKLANQASEREIRVGNVEVARTSTY